MQEMKQKTKIDIILGLCTLFYCCLQIVSILSGRFNISSYNGVFMAFQFVCCLLMVRVDYRRGARISYFLITISIINVTVRLIGMRLVAALPGLVNMIIYLITLALLSRQFGIRDKEAVSDFLTGLKNSRGLNRVLKKLIEESRAFYLMGITISNYRTINDNFGHSCAEEVLKSVGKKVNEIIGQNGIAALIDGSEFFIILNRRCNVEDVVSQLVNAISQMHVFTTEDMTFETFLNPYAGIAKYPEDGDSASVLVKYADIAMYRAKKEKTSLFCYFDKGMEEKLSRRFELEKLIKESLEKDYFYLVYQPQFTLEGKKLRGFESLIRLKTPDGTFVSPGEFIPVAEKSDLSLKIDDYVIQRAMKEFKEIVKVNKSLIISVNVSAKNFSSPDFPKKIECYLELTGFPSKNLEIEITEYCLVQSIQETVDNIKVLREMGVQVALDDFGTGYTSLSYLSKMPINLLKIDKSLVDDIVNDSKSLEFVNAVISMGHLMNCEVISEGVEDEKQLELLKSRDCDFVQGFVWGKPLMYDDAKSLAL